MTKPLLRYVLFQIPGFLVAAAILGALYLTLDISPWLIGGVLLALVVKDIVLYPFTREAYDSVRPTGHERLIGRRVVFDARTPGYVEVGGERWKARLDGVRGAPAEGMRGRVVGLDGLTLVVQVEPEDSRPRQSVV